MQRDCDRAWEGSPWHTSKHVVIPPEFEELIHHLEASNCEKRLIIMLIFCTLITLVDFLGQISFDDRLEG